MEDNMNNTLERVDAFEEVSAIFAANGIKITDSMLQLMAPLMDGSQSFEEHRAALQVELEEAV
jgi:hypothetical protein